MGSSDYKKPASVNHGNEVEEGDPYELHVDEFERGHEQEATVPWEVEVRGFSIRHHDRVYSRKRESQFRTELEEEQSLTQTSNTVEDDHRVNYSASLGVQNVVDHDDNKRNIDEQAGEDDQPLICHGIANQIRVCSLRHLVDLIEETLGRQRRELSSQTWAYFEDSNGLDAVCDEKDDGKCWLEKDHGPPDVTLVLWILAIALTKNGEQVLVLGHGVLLLVIVTCLSWKEIPRS